MGRHLRSHNDVAQRQMRTKEYTWVGVNDMQLLLRKVKQGFNTNKENLLTTSLRKAVSVTDRM
jgi:hypothetical protein